MQKEIFKDVIGYEGLYQVSNLGNVKSLKRNVKHSSGSYRFLKEKILKKSLDGWDYEIVSLCKENIKKTKKIHIMVCESFLNHKSSAFELVIDHIDSNKQNNKLSNLRIITHRENNSKERTIKSGLPVGVTLDKRSNIYISRITIDKKRVYLGCYNNIQDASNTYQQKLKQIKNYGSK